MLLVVGPAVVVVVEIAVVAIAIAVGVTPFIAIEGEIVVDVLNEIVIVVDVDQIADVVLVVVEWNRVRVHRV